MLAMSSVIPRYLEANALEYMTGIHSQNPLLVGETLDENVETTVYSELNDNDVDSNKLIGRKAVVEAAMKASAALQSIEELKVKLALYTNDETQQLVVDYGQELIIGTDDQLSLAQWKSHGILFWKWKEVVSDNESKIKALFTEGTEYASEQISKIAPEIENLQWSNAIVLTQELNAKQKEDTELKQPSFCNIV